MIHQTAIIAPDARIDETVSIGPYSVIGPGVEIGAGTSIGPHVVIQGPTVIGRDNRIFQFASIGDEPQDKKYAGEPTRLEIGDRNTIRECVTINRGTVQDEGVTRVGNDNWIMAYAHIAHDCVVGNNVILANNVGLAGHCRVDDWVIFGGFAGLHQFCRAGAHSFLGKYAGVSQDVPAYVMVGGSPPRPHGINSEGLKRRGFSAAQIANIRHGYKLLYRSGLKLSEALAEIEKLAADHPELDIFAASIRDATRSIVR
ncbi:acyl-ACP--UDP-N-acetylglucosamine O-acyltransferase [Wenzhouxiangella sp. XN24]|uniref:acyl-ACP--UDP-N-acetylglucosamine O-acyltransferase n=1 Tax=Wenzhouxiangella sp. XN24 TaxID=2713569 RepID=UPI0013EA8BAB|nr:acyl-ACP--UDP-N-acetylglucosamine O-acyltransferase [Wenzhouxiangella sp. XN24]